MKIDKKSLSSMVLGMHDALVSTLGLIAGLVFASAGNYMIVLTGIIASVAAGLSMTASQYLAVKTNGCLNSAVGQGVITGITYVASSGILLLPFVFVKNTYMALIVTYILAALIILLFNLLKSKLCSEPFWSNLAEMLIICSAVTVVAFLIGIFAKICFGIDI